MNQLAPVALIAGGITLIIFGVRATHSFSSDVSRLFTGSPTDKAMWMLIGGIITAVIGLTMTFRTSRRN